MKPVPMTALWAYLPFGGNDENTAQGECYCIREKGDDKDNPVASIFAHDDFLCIVISSKDLDYRH